MNRSPIVAFCLLFAAAPSLADGGLDPSFGAGGRVRAALPLGEWAYLSDVAHQRDGKVVIVGRTHGRPGFPPDVALLRFTSSGAPDATFGLQGFARGSFGEIDYGHAIALQPDGKILVLASTSSFPDYVRTLGLGRFETGGTLDTSYGTNGRIQLDEFDELGGRLAFQSDGRLIVMGRKAAEAVVVRRLPSGAPDPSFGVAGILNLGPGGADVTIQPDGKLLFGGSSSASGTDDFRVRRFEANGTPDTAFGVGGSATVDFEGGSDSLSGIALLADGSIVLAGTTIDAVTSDRDFVLARLTPGGTLDPAFGGAGTGRVRTAVTLNQNAVDVVRNGSRLTVVGNTSVPGGNDILLARYSLDGVLDTSYGLNGLFSVTFSATTDEIPAQASVSPDGRLVVAGLLREFSMFDFALIRTDAPCLNDFQVIATPSTCPSGDASATVIGTVPGATYAWTIQNGTILSGQGTPTIRYSAGPVGTTSVYATVSSGACEANGSASTFVDVPGCTAALGFHTLTPCRAVDTRLPDGPSAGPSLPARGSRRFPLAGICGVPADARAVAANVTVLNASTSGSLSAFAEGIPAPPTSVNAYRPGDARAAFAQLSLGENGAIRVESTQHTGSADVLVDVSGYYK